MKIILSRKGVDSSSGGFPSPIMPNGDLLSIPIPNLGPDKYSDIYYNNRSYAEIIKELRPRSPVDYSTLNCHCDPSIIRDINNKYWKPAFGQDDSANAQSYLSNRIKPNDIFLFFGWFKKTEEINGKLKFIPNTDVHVIWGYMQIEGMIKDQNEINRDYSWHPHAHVNWKNNCLYIPRETLSWDSSLPGYGVLKYNECQGVLNKVGSNISNWVLPDCFEGFNHKDEHRQEKVKECNAGIEKWVKDIIKNNIR